MTSFAKVSGCLKEKNRLLKPLQNLTMNKKIKGTNGEEFFIFLNTPEHLNLLERIVEELIIDKPNKY